MDIGDLATHIEIVVRYIDADGLVRDALVQPASNIVKGVAGSTESGALTEFQHKAGNILLFIVFHLRLIGKATMGAVIVLVVASTAHRASHDALTAIRTGLNAEFSVEFNFLSAMRAYLVGNKLFLFHKKGV